jgi:hypothetical protein
VLEVDNFNLQRHNMARGEDDFFLDYQGEDELIIKKNN